MSKKVLEHIKAVLVHDRFFKKNKDGSEKKRKPYEKKNILKDHDPNKPSIQD